MVTGHKMVCRQFLGLAVELQLEALGEQALQHPADFVHGGRAVGSCPGLDVINLEAARLVAPLWGARDLKSTQFVRRHHQTDEKALHRHATAADVEGALPRGSGERKFVPGECVRLDGGDFEAKSCRAGKYRCLCTNRG